MKIIKIATKETLKVDEVVMDNATVKDEMIAAKMAGESQGYKFVVALLSIICTFDGKKLTMEDLEKLDREDFTELVALLNQPTLKPISEKSQDCADTEN